jgi:Tol biopolymer transport system component
LALVLVAAGGSAYGSTPGMVRASVDLAGGDPNRESSGPSISADGRYVAFESEASDLVGGDENGFSDVFVRDLLGGTTTRVSVDTTGGNANGRSSGPSISADGRFVSFWSGASDLVAGDANGFEDVFVRDMVSGVTRRVSVDMDGGDPDLYSFSAAISANGRYVAFISWASDLAAEDTNHDSDVFVRDMAQGSTAPASIEMVSGELHGGMFGSPSISGDGRYVAFAGREGGYWGGTLDVFVRDLRRGVTTKVSVNWQGRDPLGESLNPDISADGRYVSFDSTACDIVPGSCGTQAYVRDMRDETTIRVSVDPDGGRAPSISADGRYVALSSLHGDVFLRDLVANTTTQVSVDQDGGSPDGASFAPSISADGQNIAFSSYASDLVPGDYNGLIDVFVRRLARDA